MFVHFIAFEVIFEYHFTKISLNSLPELCAFASEQGVATRGAGAPTEPVPAPQSESDEFAG